MRIGKQQEKVLLVLLARHRWYENLSDLEKKAYKRMLDMSAGSIGGSFYRYTENYRRRGSYLKKYPMVMKQMRNGSELSVHSGTINSLRSLEDSGMIESSGYGQGERHTFKLTEEGVKKANEIFNKKQIEVLAYSPLVDQVYKYSRPQPMPETEELTLLLFLKHDLGEGITGKEITKMCEGLRSNEDVDIPPISGVIENSYGTLQKLVVKGFLEPRVDPDGSYGNLRRGYGEDIYWMTEKGRKEAEEHLNIVKSRIKSLIMQGETKMAESLSWKNIIIS